jgi:hypothetical protein
MGSDDVGTILTTYTIMYPDPSSCEEKGQIVWPEEPGYERLRGLLVPILRGNFEHVSVKYRGKKADMFVHDEGRNMGLGFNPIATMVYRTAWLDTHPTAKPDDLQWIAGVAVVFDRRVWF